MSRTNTAANLWNSLWKQHYRIKELFQFSSYMKKKESLKEVEDNSIEEEKTNNNDPNFKPTYTKARLIGLILGPALFLVTLLFFQPSDLSSQGVATLAITLWIATWWITEAIPIPATALLPIILFPSFGALGSGEVVSSYGDDIIFLFLGGFLIAGAMEKWNLHLRIALFIINLIGVSSNRLVLGFMVSTGFLSLWISNTAAAMIMIPIGLAIITQAAKSFENKPESIDDLKKFEKSIVFGIGYAATIAGSGTLISGTANPIMAAQAKKLFDVDITFGQIMMVGIPFVAIFITLVWLYLTKVKYRTKIKYFPGGSEIIKDEKKKLGKMIFEEKIVLIIFTFVAFMWITRSFIWTNILIEVSDGMIAMLAVILLFSIPAANRKERILEWDDTKKIPWGILVLFGGGLAIAAAFTNTGLAEWIGQQLVLLEGAHYLLILSVLIASVLILTEITSTTATATLLMPIVGMLGVAIGMNPIILMVASAFATNASFMLPVATPPNAILFGTGKVSILEMIKVGGVLNIISFFLILLIATIYLPMIWGLDMFNF
ncbi:SLC13 family permease [Oceanobacillus sp. M60]|uniref:SLC13 family permease n=1 Tax=Oceanobacillus oncorhynchi TaxID=545501 RepID=UPI0021164E64|nr:DASS family sodium-coupled anion symporter [Oceanobacillus oncorhynchi]UUI40238.1 DASS family sodium-coupled anion symporter [Oceanobacillus oncorhynchi]